MESLVWSSPTQLRLRFQNKMSTTCQMTADNAAHNKKHYAYENMDIDSHGNFDHAIYPGFGCIFK